MYRQLVRLCGNHEDAEDALVEALINAFRSAEQLEDDSNFRGWLAVIARRACFRLKKKESLMKLVPLREDIAVETELAEETESEQFVLKDCIKESIERLPENYRAVYLLCEIEDVDVKVAAKRLGLSLSAAKSRLLRARAMARKEFDRSLCIEPQRVAS